MDTVNLAHVAQRLRVYAIQIEKQCPNLPLQVQVALEAIAENIRATANDLDPPRPLAEVK